MLFFFALGYGTTPVIIDFSRVLFEGNLDVCEASVDDSIHVTMIEKRNPKKSSYGFLFLMGCEKTFVPKKEQTTT